MKHLESKKLIILIMTMMRKFSYLMLHSTTILELIITMNFDL